MTTLARWLADQRVAFRLGLAAVFGVTLAAVALTGTAAIRSLGSDAVALDAHGIQPLMGIYALNGDLDGLRVRVLRHAVVRSAADKAQLQGEIDKSARADHTRSSSQGSVLISAIIGLLGVLGMATLVVRSVTKPLQALEHRLGEIADGDGDLTQRLDGERRDEMGRVGRAFNRLMDRLCTAMAAIGTSSQALASSLRSCRRSARRWPATPRRPRPRPAW